MSTRRREYETLREQLITLQKAFQSIVELDEALKGKGANAIKGFYQAQLDVLSLWLQLVDRNIAFFSEIHERAASRNLENETVELPFLEDELSNSESRAKEMIAEQQEDLQRIFDRISDIQPLQVFSRNEVDQQLDEAKMKREKTIESVEQFDEELTSKYTMLESDEQVLTALFSELMNASSQGNQVSSIYYDAASFHSSDIYSAIAASQAEATGVKKEQTSQEVESAVEENENPFIESVNSFKEIGTDFWAGFQERGDKKMDSLYDFGNYLTSGLFDGVRGAVSAMDERSDKAMDSPYDFVNYLTSGGADLVKGAVNPEDDFSKEHWLSSFGLASMVAGAKVGISNKSIRHITPNDYSNIKTKLNMKSMWNEIRLGNREINNKFLINTDKTSLTISNLIEQNGYELGEVKKLLDPDRILDTSELNIVNNLREQIGQPSSNTVMAKVIPQKDIYNYLYNPSFKGIRGYTAVKDHASNLVTLEDNIKGARLDYNNTPFKITRGIDGISESTGDPDRYFGVINYKVNNPELISVPDWKATPDSYPYTGRGFTGSKEVILPEFYQNERPFSKGDILKVVDAKDGQVSSMFIYDKKMGWLLVE